MKRRDVNRGHIWGVLHAACKAWGLPGLSACISVHFKNRLWNWKARRMDAVGSVALLDAAIYLQREHWKEEPKDRNDTLIHEAAHLVEYFRYGRCGHGKRHRELMQQAKVAVKKAGIKA